MAKPKTPLDFGPIQAPRHLGLTQWRWRLGIHRGLIPKASAGGRWPVSVIDDLQTRLPEIVEQLGDVHPFGPARVAARLAEKLDVEVAYADAEELILRGLLHDVDGLDYKGTPLYDVADVDRLANQHGDLIAAIVAERLHWLANSVTTKDACTSLGFADEYEFHKACREHQVRPGRFGRYAAADIATIAGDEDLVDGIISDRLLYAGEATNHLELPRRTEFDYLVEAGLIRPSSSTSWRVSRRVEVEVPLYRVGDLDAVLEVPGLNWEAARSVRAGDRSPFRHLVERPDRTGAQAVSGICPEADEDLSSPSD